jgi:hypothetical protein
LKDQIYAALKKASVWEDALRNQANHKETK